GAVGAGRVGGPQGRPVLGDEGVPGLRVVGEGGEHGPQPGALDPVEDGVLALQQVQVRRLPHVGGAAEGGQPLQVGAGRRDGVGVAQDAVEAAAPPGGGGQFAHQDVAGGVEVAGHLEGEGAAGGEPVGPVAEPAGVAGHPLQGGVADDEVAGFRGGPGAGVGAGEVEAAAARGGAGVVDVGPVEHLGRGVVAGDAGGGPAVGEERGDVAGAAAEVGDAGRVGREVRDAGEEVGEGAAAVAGVPQVLGGVPGGGRPGHGASCGAGRTGDEYHRPPLDLSTSRD